MKGKGEPQHVTGLVGAGTYTRTHAQCDILARIDYAHACEGGLSDIDRACIDRMNERANNLRIKQIARKVKARRA